MSETLEHNPGDHEDPLPAPTWIVMFLGVVLLSVVVLGLTALFYNAQNQEDAVKVVQRDPEEMLKMREAQQQLIHSPPRFVEERVVVEGKPEEQIVKALAIPIDQAMELVVKEAGGER